MAVDDLLIEVMDEMSRLRTWCDAVGGDGEQEQHDGHLGKYKILNLKEIEKFSMKIIEREK